MFASERDYLEGAFRLTRTLRIRKVLPETCSMFDLLQELVAIDGEFRASGRVQAGTLVAFAQAKGGVGATSICAALGELCSVRQRKTLLWDLDI